MQKNVSVKQISRNRGIKGEQEDFGQVDTQEQTFQGCERILGSSTYVEMVVSPVQKNIVAQVGTQLEENRILNELKNELGFFMNRRNEPGF